jgi:hypothetical protein
MAKKRYILMFFLLLATKAEALGWLAYGDLRGYLEPCGCDPETDMGGLKRIAAQVERERILDPNLWLFDLGNNLPFQASQVKTKSPYLLEGLSSLKPSARLLNVSELLAFAQIKEAKVSNAFVLSNWSGQSLASVKKVARIPGAAILGYTYHLKVDGLVKRISPELSAQWRKLLGGKKEHKVLLFSGPKEDLAKILSANIFDTIVSSNNKPDTAAPDRDERDREQLLVRNQSPFVPMVPLGGQGMLRGGDKQVTVAQPLSAIIGGSSSCKPGIIKNDCRPVEGVLGSRTFVSWLSPEVGGEDKLKDLFNRYYSHEKADFKNWSEQRKKHLQDSNFVGSAACKSCHVKEFDKWQQTAHSKAMSTLKAKSMDQNRECVTCHVVGASSRGGFVSMQDSPHLANVQCENCHGPRKEHVGDPRKSKTTRLAKEVCTDCHKPPHSTAFSYEKYWKKIAH